MEAFLVTRCVLYVLLIHVSSLSL